jgi:hypothetical protein
MSKRAGKYLQHPWAPEAEWIALNPELKNGEEGYAIVVINDVTHIRKKVGPGNWNDLEYFNGVVWENTNPVTNPIGDASGNIAGLTPIEILDKMLNTYQTPVISSASNNGGSSNFEGTKSFEIGTSIVNFVTVKYIISNQNNLTLSNPVTVTANGRFTNEGLFPVGDVVLTHSGIASSGLDEITISIKASHEKGITNTATTRIQYNPKIIFVVGQTKPTNGDQIMAFANKSFYVTRTFKRDYSFGGAGHSIVCIPTMLSPSNLQFSDVTNPNSIQGYAMDDLGVLSINNGVATYNYQVYTSTYYLLNPTILRIS